ncbi:hypothetical protein TPHV1_290019 [Treponema phagedenis]|uniref:Uncharacterized protein n=1 Tax=Treponema phagedenis TaxID=162 RepID=A0A0B7GX08_TREPH|nr:hypothetical protein TPHV1_290019 [Treponema phagedenis]
MFLVGHMGKLQQNVLLRKRIVRKFITAGSLVLALHYRLFRIR